MGRLAGLPGQDDSHAEPGVVRADDCPIPHRGICVEGESPRNVQPACGCAPRRKARRPGETTVAPAPCPHYVPKCAWRGHRRGRFLVCIGPVTERVKWASDPIRGCTARQIRLPGAERSEQRSRTRAHPLHFGVRFPVQARPGRPCSPPSHKRSSDVSRVRPRDPAHLVAREGARPRRSVGRSRSPVGCIR